MGKALVQTDTDKKDWFISYSYLSANSSTPLVCKFIKITVLIKGILR